MVKRFREDVVGLVDVVRCDTKEVKNFSRKWTLGALKNSKRSGGWKMFLVPFGNLLFVYGSNSLFCC